MAQAKLHILLGGERMGILKRDSRGRISLVYTQEWLSKETPVPLSVSMPVLPTIYSGSVIENWLWGLLPDNEDTLRRWAQRFQVSVRNVFELLAHLGEDVAGAIQIVRPDREKAAITKGKIRWLSSKEFDERLTSLRADAVLAREAEDPGRFSLAGVQSKTALLFQKGRWGVPSGRIPTNRIVKLAGSAYSGLIENEHFCLSLANAIGLNAAETSVLNRAGVTAIIVNRYDRIELSGKLIRLHQEDMCQALSVHPVNRYQNEGGPGILDIFKLLNNSSDPQTDQESFLRAQIFNFLVGGTDAHAKNFSLLLGEQGVVRLAPLYDVASMLPYANYKQLDLAMRIGDSYDFAHTLARHWEALRGEIPLTVSPVDLLEEYAQKMPTTAKSVAAKCRIDGIEHNVIGELEDQIKKMCARTLMAIGQFRKQG